MGALIWQGDNNTSDWDGYANKGMLFDNQKCPDGTYYYVIELNDSEYPIPLAGFYTYPISCSFTDLFSKVGKYHLNFTAIKRTTIITRELIRYKISLSKLNFLRIKKTTQNTNSGINFFSENYWNLSA
jgi:hypothetical protein